MADKNLAISDQNPDSAEVIARACEGMQRLAKAGINHADWQKLVNSPQFLRRVVQLWHENKATLSLASIAEARAYYKEGTLLDTLVARDKLGIATDDAWRVELPFTDEELKEKKDTHALVWYPGMSVRSLMKRFPRYFACGLPESAAEEQFLNEWWPAGWHLLRRGAVPRTANKKYKNQTECLRDGEGVPVAGLLAYALVAHLVAFPESQPLIGIHEAELRSASSHHALSMRIGIDLSSKVISCRLWGQSQALYGVGLASEHLPESRLFA